MLPNRIREIRKRLRLTQKQVAERMGDGIRQPTVQRLETGKLNLTAEYIEKLCAALEVAPYELFPQGDEVEWIPVVGIVTMRNNKAVQMFAKDDIYKVPFARDRNVSGMRAALEFTEFSNSYYIYQTDHFVIESGAEYIVEDRSGNILVRKSQTGSDGRLYLICDLMDPTVLPIPAEDANIIGRVVAEYVTK